MGFYVILPVLCVIASHASLPRQALSRLFLAGGIVSFAFAIAPIDRDVTLIKILDATPVGHFHLFTLGGLAYLHYARLKAIVTGRFWPLFAAIIAMAFMLSGLPERAGSQWPGPTIQVLLVIPVFAFAVGTKALVGRTGILGILGGALASWRVQKDRAKRPTPNPLRDRSVAASEPSVGEAGQCRNQFRRPAVQDRAPEVGPIQRSLGQSPCSRA
jgi:hypothetical protein